MLESGSRIYVAGHRGLVGRAICGALRSRDIEPIVAPRETLDLRDAAAVGRFFEHTRPTHIFLAAAKVGGIVANATYPADFIADNLAIALNVIRAAHQYGVQKLLNLGSSCIYPREAPQPIQEGALLTGPLEPTNRAYAVAKIAAIELCDSFRAQHGCHFISAMPTNLYGPHDNFDLKTSHVIPALLRRFVEAKDRGTSEVVLWGTGVPLREFMYVDDLADACLLLMDDFDEPGPINVGTGHEVSIRELATRIARVVGYDGAIAWDDSKPDGTPRKRLDISRLAALGFEARIELDEGLNRTLNWFLEHRLDSGITP